MAEDLNLDLGPLGRVEVEVAERQLDRPAAPFHVVGKVQEIFRLRQVPLVGRSVVLIQDRDHRHGRERPLPLPEPQPERSERRAVRRPQEQKPPKVSQEGLIHSLELFWKGSRPLLEIPMGEDLSDRVESPLRRGAETRSPRLSPA